MKSVTISKNQNIASAPMTVETPAILAGLASKYSELHRLATRRASEETAEWLRGRRPVTDRREIETARTLARVIPERLILHEQQIALYDAVYVPASEQEIRIVCAAIIGSITHASATAGLAFVESLVFSILHADDDESSPWAPREGFSTPVLYVAARRIIAKSKFCPSIAEVIEEATLAREMFHRALTTTMRLTELKLAADDLIELVDDPIIADSAGEDTDEIPE